MGASERRRAILEVLCQRRQDTRENLAHEFGVSLRTISNDIDELSRTYPIITTRGKYGGGIKVLDGYRLDRKYLNPAQQHLLKRLAQNTFRPRPRYYGKYPSRLCSEKRGRDVSPVKHQEGWCSLKTEYPSYTEHSLPAVTRGKPRPASANGTREDNHGGR